MSKWLAFISAVSGLLAPLALAAEDVQKLIADLKSQDVNTRRDSATQLGQLGPAARPAVAALVENLTDRDKQAWSNAMGALASIGPDAADAIPALIECLDGSASGGRGGRDGEQMTLRAAYALTQIGKPAIPPLIKILENGDKDSRAGAAMALGGMGAEAAEAIPALVANLGHEDDDIRQAIANGLGGIGPVAVPQLSDALGANEPRQRAASATALGVIGKGAQSAAPKLIEQIQREDNAETKARELIALPRLKPDPIAVVPIYVAALKDSQESIRRAGINGLLLTRDAFDQSIPALIALLESGDPEQSRLAIVVLGRMGPVAEKAIPSIIRVAQQNSKPDEVYLESLARMGEPVIPRVFEAVEKESPDTLTGDHWSVRCLKSVGAVGIPKLTEALKSPNLSVRIVAARSLGEMGANADRAETALMELLNDPDPRMRAIALGSLVGVKASTDVVVPRIKAAIEDNSTAVRLTGLQLVPALGEAGKTLVPSVMAALKDPDDTVRRAALNALDSNSGAAVPTLIEQLDDSTLRPAVVDALIRIGPSSSDAVPKLVALLPKAPKSQRLQIFELLAKLGSGASAARPEISGSLNDQDAELRAAATSAFASLEGEAALPVMVSALDDPDPKVRQVAAEALGGLGEKAQEAAPKLIVLLQQESDRAASLEALKRVSVDSIPDLLEMLKIEDSDVKIFACERLRRVGRGKEEVIAPLEAAMRDDNSNVRRAARRAMERVKQK